jgi:hypothetical protein
MADIKCANCGEPWDTYHLRHDEPLNHVHTLIMPNSDISKIADTCTVPPVKYIRNSYTAAGWKLAGWNIFAILRCPCCKQNGSNPDKLRATRAIAAAEALGTDPDAMSIELAEPAHSQGGKAGRK